ncbi:MAG: efflux RND transporter periplasmic adaptor subunit [Phycisphaerae bacterium]|jgi:Cu(I)/Ag(I) efflux system membrane fusion protein
MTPPNPEPARAVPETPGPRHGWPADLTYRDWKMKVVRVVLSTLVLAGVFGLGTWYGLGRGQAGSGPAAHAATAPAGEPVRYWTCSMHPQVQLPAPGKCPICFMDLVPVRAGEEAGGAKAPRLTLSPRARELARVETALAEPREVSVEVPLVGKIMPDETRITYISSYVPGRLDRLFVDYTGILVRKGDHLAEIYSPDLLVAQREYLLGLEAVERAGRATGLEHELATANALLEAARRKLELWGIPKDELETLARDRRPSDHMRIDAPLEGWVIERSGYQGMYVETGTRLFTLADLRTVWVMLDAYELDIGYVRLGQDVDFETEAYPGQVFRGRVAYVDPVLNPATRTVRVRVNVDNPDARLRPEMFVRARLKARLGQEGRVVETNLAGKWLCPMHPEVVRDDMGNCDKCGMKLVRAETLGYVTQGAAPARLLTVPRTAVLLTGKRAVVYVEQKKADGSPVYEGRVVKLGPRAGEYYVVESGLTAGERVVVRGALMIDSALQIMARPSMMQPDEKATAASGPVASGPASPSRYVAGAPYHRHVAPVLEGYLELVKALAADDAGATAAAIGQVRHSLKAAVPHGLEGDGAEAFRRQMAALEAGLPPAAATVAQARGQLPALTQALTDYLKTFGHDRSEPLVEAFCPMAFDNKGGRWLQAARDIRNPYFGEKMLRCGEIQGLIGPDGKVGH